MRVFPLGGSGSFDVQRKRSRVSVEFAHPSRSSKELRRLPLIRWSQSSMAFSGDELWFSVPEADPMDTLVVILRTLFPRIFARIIETTSQRSSPRPVSRMAFLPDAARRHGWRGLDARISRTLRSRQFPLARKLMSAIRCAPAGIQDLDIVAAACRNHQQ